MKAASTSSTGLSSGRYFGAVDLFLRADASSLREWILGRQRQVICLSICSILAGSGLYGAVMGCWRDAWQALYTAIKIPLVILLTTVGNGLLNGMLAPLLGLNVSFRQSALLVLISFAVTALILGALSPVAWFVVWNTPPLTEATRLWSVE